jgi:hypothetical protein
MRVVIIAAFLGGCAPSLGVPLEGTDGVLRCYDGDRVTDARPVCDTVIAVRTDGGSGSCSVPLASDLGCIDGTYCTRYPERCMERPVCFHAANVERCAEWVSACIALGASECVVEIDGTGPVRAAD